MNGTLDAALNGRIYRRGREVATLHLIEQIACDSSFVRRRFLCLSSIDEKNVLVVKSVYSDGSACRCLWMQRLLRLHFEPRVHQSFITCSLRFANRLDYILACLHGKIFSSDGRVTSFCFNASSLEIKGLITIHVLGLRPGGGGSRIGNASYHVLGWHGDQLHVALALFLRGLLY